MLVGETSENKKTGKYFQHGAIQTEKLINSMKNKKRKLWKPSTEKKRLNC